MSRCSTDSFSSTDLLHNNVNIFNTTELYTLNNCEDSKFYVLHLLFYKDIMVW